MLGRKSAVLSSGGSPKCLKAVLLGHGGVCFVFDTPGMELRTCLVFCVYHANTFSVSVSYPSLYMYFSFSRFSRSLSPLNSVYPRVQTLHFSNLLLLSLSPVPLPYPYLCRMLALACVMLSCRKSSISEPLGCLISCTSGVTSWRRPQP